MVVSLFKENSWSETSSVGHINTGNSLKTFQFSKNKLLSSEKHITQGTHSRTMSLSLITFTLPTQNIEMAFCGTA